MSAKVLFIGLDAADPELIIRWTKEGYLPNLGSLMAKGAWGWTENPPGLYVGAVWPSFSTSVSPARHSRYCYTQLVPGGYETKSFRPTDVKWPPFWKFLSNQGKKIAVIDVPKVSVDAVNGIQIADWGTHDPEYGEMKCWPEDLAEEVTGRFGVNAVHDCNAERHSAADFSEFRDMLTARIHRKRDMISHFLARGNWDCLIASFSESHCVGHQCWHLHDPTHPRHDAAVARACGNPILDVYRELDSAVGKLNREVDSDTLVIVLASHGMGPHYEATYLLEPILERLEKARYGSRRPVARPALKRLWNRLPRGLRKRWQPLRVVAKNAGLSPLAAKRYFKIPNNDVFGGVRINLAGREPHGRVQPGLEFEQVCDHLIDDLNTLINVETGEKLVTAVVKTWERYKGENLHYLPDLMIEWNRSAPVSLLHSPLIGTVRGEYTGCRTGDHKAQGLFLARGPNIRPGQYPHSVSVMDFGPTMAFQTGLDLPNVDGHRLDPMTPSS